MFRKDFTDEFGESSVHMLKECTFSFNVVIGLPRNSRYRTMYFHLSVFFRGVYMPYDFVNFQYTVRLLGADFL